MRTQILPFEWHGTPVLVVITLEIDYFNRLKDAYGSSVGDVRISISKAIT